MRLGISALALIGACVFAAGSALADDDDTYNYNPPPPYYGGGPGSGFQDPSAFSWHVASEMNGIEIDLRDRIRDGFVRPQALNEFALRRNDIQNDLNRAFSDGVVTPDERIHIERDVQNLRGLETRYQRPYGGGPRYRLWRWWRR